MKVSKFEVLVFINIFLVGIIVVLSFILKSDNYSYETVVYRKEYFSEEVKEEIEKIKEEKRKEQLEEELRLQQVVYDNLTYSELVDKINRHLNSTLSGKGHLFVDYCLEFGVDPYLAVSIALHETGCKWNCSYLTNACNNVGGQKGYGCGEYASFNSIEEGIYAFVSNIYHNYYLFGLTNADLMNSKYAESTTWASNVNRYINEIKNS